MADREDLIIIKVNRRLNNVDFNQLITYYQRCIDSGFLILDPDCELIESKKKKPITEWVCFADEVPEEGEHILLYNKNVNIINDDWFSSTSTLYECTRDDLDDVFWIPFPEVKVTNDKEN